MAKIILIYLEIATGFHTPTVPVDCKSATNVTVFRIGSRLDPDSIRNPEKGKLIKMKRKGKEKLRNIMF